MNRMNLYSSNEYELHFFSKEVCRYCRYAKPIYEQEIKPIFLMNGIPCIEWDTSNSQIDLSMKHMLEIHQIKTVPTLIILETSIVHNQTQTDNETETEKHSEEMDIKPTILMKEIFRADSTTIRNSLSVLQSLYHSLDDTF
jgi:glutaredoxin